MWKHLIYPRHTKRECLTQCGEGWVETDSLGIWKWYGNKSLNSRVKPGTELGKSQKMFGPERGPKHRQAHAWQEESAGLCLRPTSSFIAAAA